MARTKASGVRVRVQRLAHGAGLPLPAYQTDGAAGLDLVAALPASEPLVLAPQARALVPTGLVLELPPGYEGQVRPRSGLALKQGLTVLNSPGTIDSDYRGEVMILLANLGGGQVEVRRGDRIAQLVVAPVITVRLEVVAELSKTRRGPGGFGSTVTKGTAAKRKSRKSSRPKRAPMRKPKP
jgi:dUTP pyrophosphatase